ncbi:putative uridine kinase Das2p [Diutina catenulata]
MVVVLIGGGHGSGKATTAKKLYTQLIKITDQVTVMDMDQFQTSDPEFAYSAESDRVISAHKDNANPPLKPSRYDFAQLSEEIARADGPDAVVVVHGLYALYDKQVRQMAHLKVFISGDPDTRLIRWLRRDVLDGNKPLASVLNYYVEGAKQEMNDFVIPTKELADIVIPGAEDMSVSLIVDGVLQQRGEKPAVAPPRRNLLRPTARSSFFDAS